MSKESLEKSIKKWEGIVAGTEVDRGGMNCALCQEYAFTDNGEDCYGCPVNQRTGQHECAGTPYYLFTSQKIGSKEKTAAAQLMLDFLKSLRGDV